MVGAKLASEALAVPRVSQRMRPHSQNIRTLFIGLAITETQGATIRVDSLGMANYAHWFLQFAKPRQIASTCRIGYQP